MQNEEKSSIFFLFNEVLLGWRFLVSHVLAGTSGAGLAGSSRRWTSEGVPTDGSNICAWSW